MRIRKHDYLVIALAAPLFLAACADKDVYNPDKVRPIAPVENPLGKDFVAPDGFNWSMITTVKVNIEVKDEFNGQYNYLIEVFTSNPLSDKTATPLAAGYAKHGSNYVTEINIPKATEHLFIRQTDPKQFKEVYEFAIPENGDKLNCQLYYTENETARTSTRAKDETGTSGWDLITDPGYVEEKIDIPDDATSISGDKPNGWTSGKVFVIEKGKTYKKSFFTDNLSTLYVAGTWAPENVNMQKVNIIVLKGGNITSTGDFHVADNSSLTIQSGANAEFNIFGTTTNIVIKNFGTFKAKNIIRSNGHGFNSGSKLYNGENALFIVEEYFKLTDSDIYNHGKIEITGVNGILEANSNGGTIANYAQASIKTPSLLHFGRIVNSGTIDTNICQNESGGSLYNNCLLIARNKFQFTTIELDHGSITGEQNEKGQWLPVNEFKIGQPTNLTMKNGSIIKAKSFWIANSINHITGTGDISMIKIEELRLTNQGDTHIKGNLVLEGWENPPAYIQIDSNIPQTDYDSSKYTIETCAGIINEGNSGNPDPVDPPKPDTGDNTIYTYAFEDQWPAYGDFDMNDIVITIDRMNITDSKKLTIQGNVRAVGANRKTGAGIQFLNVSSSGVTLSGKVQNGAPAFESGQDHPVVILCTNAHKYCNPSIADDDFTFYSTDPTSGNNSGDGAAFEIAMTFPTAEAATEAMNIDNLDVFIISKEVQGNIKRTEIHLPNYAPTQLATTALFGMGNDASARNSMLNVDQKGYYISTEGLAWGICIPSTKVWEWPKEWKMITDVYPDFKGWVTSGGASNTDWISNHNNDIYVKP